MFRPHSEEHLIDEGRVFCPVRKRDVEFDLCAGCRWTTSIDLKGSAPTYAPVVRCRPESTPVWVVRPWL
jgi:hypothetical protein